MGSLKVFLKNKPDNLFQIFLFTFCLLSSIFLYSLLETVDYNINEYINLNSKETAGGDILIRSRSSFSEDFLDELNNFEKNNDAKITYLYELTTIAYSNKTDDSLLTSLKIVDNNYPLYGNLTLKSGRDYKSLDKEKKAFVKQGVLEQLNLNIGDFIKIGDSTFEIYDTISNEPDESFDFISFGEKIIIQDKDDINLLTNKSRVSFKAYIKTNSLNDYNLILSSLKKFENKNIRIETYEEERDGLNSFIANFLSFFKIILFFLLILFGVGLNTTIGAFIQKREKEIAIMKTLGEKNTHIRNNILKIVLSILLFCFLLNFLFLEIIFNFVNENFKNLINENIILQTNFLILAKCFFIFFIFTIISVLLPILRLENIKPNLIFKKEEVKIKSRKMIFTIILILIIFLIFSIVEFNDLVYGVSYFFGLILIFLIIYFLVKLILDFFKAKKTIFNFPIRQAISNINRVGSKTNIFIMIISICLILIFSIVILEKNIEQNFIQNYPENSPNIFLIDIVEEDVSKIEKIVGNSSNTFPIIRAPITFINDKSIKQISKEISFERRVTRDFSLTYYEEILKTERLTKSENGKMFLENSLENNLFQVSVLSEIGDVLNTKVGDIITFSIQGVLVKAKVVSLRERLDNSISPYFYFVFKEEEIKNAPKTIYMTAKLDNDKISDVQKELAKNYPYITSINVFDVVQKVSNILEKLFLVAIFFTIIGIICGFIVLISSLLLETPKRLEEIAFYKILGSNKSFILKTLLYEYFFIGFIGSLIGIIFSNIISYTILKYVFNLKFSFFFFENFIFLFSSVLTLLVFGILFSYRIIKQKPTKYLKENTIE